MINCDAESFVHKIDGQIYPLTGNLCLFLLRGFRCYIDLKLLLNPSWVSAGTEVLSNRSLGSRDGVTPYYFRDACVKDYVLRTTVLRNPVFRTSV